MIDVRTTNTTAAKSSAPADEVARFGKQLNGIILEQKQLIKEKQAAVAEWQKTLDDLTLAKDTKNKSDTKVWSRKLKKATVKRDAQHDKLVKIYSKKKRVAMTEAEITRAEKILQHLQEKGAMRDNLLTCHFASTTTDIDEAEAMLKRLKEEKDKPTKAMMMAKDMVNKLEGELVKLKDDLIKLEKARKKKGIQPVQVVQAESRDEQDTSVMSVEMDEAMSTFEQLQKLVSKQEKIIEKKTNSLHKWQRTLVDLTQARAAKNKSTKEWNLKLNMNTAERDAKIKVYTEACLKRLKEEKDKPEMESKYDEVKRAEKVLQSLKEKGNEPTKSMKKAEKNLTRLKEEKDKLTEEMKHAEDLIHTLQNELVKLNANKDKLEEALLKVRRPHLGFLGEYLFESIGCFMCGDDSYATEETDDDFTRCTDYTEVTDY